jgi:predicted dehydrogenase
VSASKPVNAAIVGLGRWGQNLVTAASDQSNPQLRFVQGVTRTPAKAVDFALLHGFPVSDDFDAMLGDPSIEAVVLATPHSQHCAQICKAAQAGKHVFVEKPLALTLDEAREAIAQCNKHGVVLAVGFNRRFLPAFKELSDAYDAGKLGTALHIDANFSGPFGYDYTAEMWRGTSAENPAGGMAAMGVHMLDVMIHLLGPVRSVSTLSRRRAIEAPLDDTTHVQIDFECGATGSLTTLMATQTNWRLQLFGSSGWAALRDQQTIEFNLLGQDVSLVQHDTTDTLADELAAFVACVRGQAHYPVTQPEAMAGVAAMEAISLSAAKNGERTSVASV